MALKEFLDKTCFVGVGPTPQGQLPDQSGCREEERALIVAGNAAWVYRIE